MHLITLSKLGDGFLTKKRILYPNPQRFGKSDLKFLLVYSNLKYLKGKYLILLYFRSLIIIQYRKYSKGQQGAVSLQTTCFFWFEPHQSLYSFI
jgi:hypothetical protein